jgi:hypothetical protein
MVEIEIVVLGGQWFYLRIGTSGASNPKSPPGKSREMLHAPYQIHSQSRRRAPKWAVSILQG